MSECPCPAIQSAGRRLLPMLGLMFCAAAATAQTGDKGAAPAPAASQAPAPAPAPAPEIRFSFSEATLRLPTAQSKGTVDVLISAEATGKESLPAETISVVDITSKDAPAGSPKVSFEVVAEAQAGAKTRSWFLRAVIEALPVNSTPLSRTALVTLGAFKRTLTYVVTNKPASPPDFTVVQPATWSSTEDKVAAAILISAGDQPLRGLRLAHAALSDKSQTASIPLQALDLCSTATGACVAPSPIPAGSSETVYLRFKALQRPLGRYTGTVSLAVEARADAKPVTIDINATSSIARAAGTVVILVGIIVALTMSVWSRNRLQRLAALQPVAAARERIERLLFALEPVRLDAGVEFDRTCSHFDRIRFEKLDEAALDAEGLLPKVWSVSASATSATALQERLKLLEPEIAGLAVMVREGALVLVTRLKAVAADDPKATEKRVRIIAAIPTLDDPTKFATEQAAGSLVAAALQASVLPSGLEVFNPGSPMGRTPQSVQRITGQIEALSRATWFMYAVLTAVAGTATLILQNPGFGTCLDFVFCLFWGFGMPVTLEKLQQLSPTQTAKAVGITLPA